LDRVRIVPGGPPGIMCECYIMAGRRVLLSFGTLAQQIEDVLLASPGC
jgi:hypothetical protein